jgi:hypothetical protein
MTDRWILVIIITKKEFNKIFYRHAKNGGTLAQGAHPQNKRRTKDPQLAPW